MTTLQTLRQNRLRAKRDAIAELGVTSVAEFHRIKKAMDALLKERELASKTIRVGHSLARASDDAERAYSFTEAFKDWNNHSSIVDELLAPPTKKRKGHDSKPSTETTNPASDKTRPAVKVA